MKFWFVCFLACGGKKVYKNPVAEIMKIAEHFLGAKTDKKQKVMAMLEVVMIPT